ncbi:flavodoxin family protein [Pseudodesulfovibrio piezophilus]|uniref:NADPH-dependent FMN reductase n=1 Tax=Pseudodesulfovibrio piezophilus (strain DSM 21447 / JCM 15486 / C1TLV30) TaxID=1322246 RepID=M1WK54_PSEP2|nr:flavodoxin family protein [Pseudodesulfovibrio piezophilus]CCH49006.1 NADPH-dependent FMN reductase [Pseudodesulfovibrio piezophilus C1TLV30]
MKVVAINGSSRKGGNTSEMVKRVSSELEAEGIEVEVIDLAGKTMKGCIACYKCFENKDRLCAVKNDFVNECIAAMDGADGILLASPTYFANISPEIKALIDRAGMVGIANDYMYARKAGAGIVVKRRGGAMQAFNALNSFFFIEQMMVPGSRYWNLCVGREKGEVLEDAEGMETMEVLGKNMAWLMKKLED